MTDEAFFYEQILDPQSGGQAEDRECRDEELFVPRGLENGSRRLPRVHHTCAQEDH